MNQTTDLAKPGHTCTLPRVPMILIAAIAAAIVLGMPATAQAHTELAASSPGQGSEVSIELDRIVLEFGEELLPMGVAVVVRGPDGSTQLLAGWWQAMTRWRPASSSPHRDDTPWPTGWWARTDTQRRVSCGSR